MKNEKISDPVQRALNSHFWLGFQAGFFAGVSTVAVIGSILIAVIL